MLLWLLFMHLAPHNAVNLANLTYMSWAPSSGHSLTWTDLLRNLIEASMY
jgi:hypothetical protein